MEIRKRAKKKKKKKYKNISGSNDDSNEKEMHTNESEQAIETEHQVKKKNIKCNNNNIAQEVNVVTR